MITSDTLTRMIGMNAIYIAATAIVHKSTVITRNTSDFKQVQGLSVEEY
ncbi:MAG: type II toxin-antitoxin system VapC family toxin [Thaumarchaeota archaeon]|nr:type II toxin-antitoxin system VapC family toxin [Nitrososphaerota archaeon]